MDAHETLAYEIRSKCLEELTDGRKGRWVGVGRRGQGRGLRSRVRTGGGRMDRMRWGKWWKEGLLRAHRRCQLYQLGELRQVGKARLNSGTCRFTQ